MKNSRVAPVEVWTPSLEARMRHADIPARVSREQERAWKAIRAERVQVYLDACSELSNAIVENAGEFLVHRGRQIAANLPTRGGLPPAAEQVLQAQAPALAASLSDGLGRVRWLQAAPWLRTHAGGERIPPELTPLEALVDASLRVLSTSYGLPLHPAGVFAHQPLASEAWPSVRHERVRAAVKVAHGGRVHEWELRAVPHPVQVKFRAVAEAASVLDAHDVREEKGS
jgi:hypothetical protein